MKSNKFTLLLALIASAYYTSQAQQADSKMSARCNELHNGRFISTVDNGKTWVEIARKDGLQTERQGNEESTSQITWKSDCSYNLTVQSLSEGMADDDLRKTFRVTIDKIEGDKYYYTFYNEKSEVEFSGYMKKLE